MFNKVAVSVVIASHRPAMLEKTLTSLRNQCHTTINVEIIVVTDYPSGSLQHHFPEITWLYVPHRSISRKRNCGVACAQGEVLAFIDDDCYADPEWIAQGFGYLSKHSATAAVVGKTTVEQGTAGVLREYRRLEKRGYRTNNLFFRTAVFKGVGGFDERFTVQREDMDLAFTTLEQGYCIDFCDTIKVLHAFRAGERWDLLKNCWNRRFDPLLFKKHPALYLRHVGFPVPPALALPGLLHCMVLFSFLLNKRRFAAGVIVVDGGVIALLGRRRCGVGNCSPAAWVPEVLQMFAAPVVVLYALLYGCLLCCTSSGNKI